MQSSPLEHARRAVCNYTARGAAESSNGLRPADNLFLNKSQGVHPIVMQLQPSAWWTWQVHTLRTGPALKAMGVAAGDSTCMDMQCTSVLCVDDREPLQHGTKASESANYQHPIQCWAFKPIPAVSGPLQSPSERRSPLAMWPQPVLE